MLLGFLGALAMLFMLTQQSPQAAASIGRMVVGYTELEFGLMSCIDIASDDFDALFKAMFRTRGETQRLEIADAIGRYRFHALKLGTEFEMALGAIQYCLKIRNQYAHCHWLVVPGRIGFVDLEEVAKENKLAHGESRFTYHNLTPDLVTKQESYFDYTDHFLWWLQSEAAIKRGKEKANPAPKPKQEARPPLYMPQG